MKYQVSKFEVMMEFWVYPVLAMVLGAAASRQSFLIVLSLVAFGVFAWSFAEYALHRWLFHGRTPVASDHQRHHANPAGYIGLSGWYTLALFFALFAALWWVVGESACALVLGFMMGYYLYITFHYWFHHKRLAPGSWLHALKVRHVRHHVGGHENFGVTSPLWDKVFRTFR